MITRPSENRNRYLVDKFNPSTKQAKQTLFQSIDLTAYEASPKCASFCTSESRLPLWVRVFATRYDESLNQTNIMDPTPPHMPVQLWEDCNTFIGYRCKLRRSTCCDHYFLSTGRFLIQGKLYEEWSLNEFPILLYTVNSIQSLDMLDTSKDKLLCVSSMSTFFKSFIYFVSDDSIPTSAETASISLTHSKSTKYNCYPTHHG